jgi:hypothetical protein
MCDRFGDDVGLMYYPVLNAANKDRYGKDAPGGQKTNCGFMVYSRTKNPDAAADLAIGLALMKNEYEYTVMGNFQVPYDADKLGWELPNTLQPAAQKLFDDMKKFEWSKNFIQDIMPNATGTTLCMQFSAQFFTDANYTPERYLADMDTAVAAD